MVAAASRGLVFGLASPTEVDLAERIAARVPGCEMVRFVVTGTEATMSAVRVARAATGRRVIVKFAGAYHGHADMFLVSAGSGAATFGTPDSPGVTPGAVEDTAIARFNDLASVDRCFTEAAGGVAAVIVEPVVGNMGCVPPGRRLPRRPAHALHPARRRAHLRRGDDRLPRRPRRRGRALRRHARTWSRSARSSAAACRWPPSAACPS